MSALASKIGSAATRGYGDPLSIQRTVAVATFGGLASRATGGDFLQGAMTAAMVHLFNELTATPMTARNRQLYVKEVKGFTANDLLLAGHEAYAMTFDQEGLDNLSEYVPSVNDPEESYLPPGIRRDYIRAGLLGKGGFLSMIKADYTVLSISELPSVLENIYGIFTGRGLIGRSPDILDLTNSIIDATTFNNDRAAEIFRFYGQQHNLWEEQR